MWSENKNTNIDTCSCEQASKMLLTFIKSESEYTSFFLCPACLCVCLLFQQSEEFIQKTNTTHNTATRRKAKQGETGSVLTDKNYATIRALNSCIIRIRVFRSKMRLDGWKEKTNESLKRPKSPKIGFKTFELLLSYFIAHAERKARRQTGRKGDFPYVRSPILIL